MKDTNYPSSHTEAETEQIKPFLTVKRRSKWAFVNHCQCDFCTSVTATSSGGICRMLFCCPGKRCTGTLGSGAERVWPSGERSCCHASADANRWLTRSVVCGGGQRNGAQHRYLLPKKSALRQERRAKAESASLWWTRRDTCFV